ncbi:MAG: thiamine pyrophosphate-binding protein [Gammaproteobacteria bacterium]|nr:thiamine pyrophosphate-binding protein [Gammaproteobacteria bacterium]MDX2461890.1 thiamine pyrophosphate-binding protein [Gammaproteobacteria bacterium]
MTNISGGEAVYRVLKDAGITTVFGLLGGSMLELFDAMYADRGIAYIGARDERAAGHMADAYARINGGPGIVLGAQAGPGVVNLATAVAEASLAYSPLVVIAGAISRADLGKDTFQEVDQVALFQPICKRSLLVTDAERLPAMLVDAMRLAMSGRRGPVVLHVPRDLFTAQVAEPAFGALSIARAGGPAAADIAAIIQSLQSATRPVIFAGGGLKWAGGAEALARLAEQLQLPVVASTGHADVMPADHPLFAGQGGPRGNRVASRLTREADLILVIGARLGFNSTFHSHDYISPSAKLIQIDIEGSAIGRYFPVELGILADARAAAEAILDQAGEIDSSTWADWREAFHSDHARLMKERDAEAANPSEPMHPRRALGEIRGALPKNAIVTLDTGNACLQAADRMLHYQTPALVTPLDFGLVGFGYAAALGARAAAPDRPVISIIGDGGFGFTLAEFTTALRHDLPVIAIVLDNGAWGAEKAYQQEFFGGRLLGADINSPPYDDFARSCGGKGYRVEKPGELSAALNAALAERVASVIHVKIDPSALSTLRKDLFTTDTEDTK